MPDIKPHPIDAIAEAAKHAQFDEMTRLTNRMDVADNVSARLLLRILDAIETDDGESDKEFAIREYMLTAHRAQKEDIRQDDRGEEGAIENNEDAAVQITADEGDTDVPPVEPGTNSSETRNPIEALWTTFDEWLAGPDRNPTEDPTIALCLGLRADTHEEAVGFLTTALANGQSYAHCVLATRYFSEKQYTSALEHTILAITEGGYHCKYALLVEIVKHLTDEYVAQLNYDAIIALHTRAYQALSSVDFQELNLSQPSDAANFRIARDSFYETYQRFSLKTPCFEDTENAFTSLMDDIEKSATVAGQFYGEYVNDALLDAVRDVRAAYEVYGQNQEDSRATAYTHLTPLVDVLQTLHQQVDEPLKTQLTPYLNIATQTLNYLKSYLLALRDTSLSELLNAVQDALNNQDSSPYQMGEVTQSVRKETQKNHDAIDACLLSIRSEATYSDSNYETIARLISEFRNSALALGCTPKEDFDSILLQLLSISNEIASFPKDLRKPFCVDSSPLDEPFEEVEASAEIYDGDATIAPPTIATVLYPQRTNIQDPEEDLVAVN